jgi:hypothetical protein
MMGDQLVMQECLFYQFRLDDHVPADHLSDQLLRSMFANAVKSLTSPPFPQRGLQNIYSYASARSQPICPDMARN